VREKYNLYISGLVLLCFAAGVALIFAVKTGFAHFTKNYEDVNQSQDQNHNDSDFSDDDKLNNAASSSANPSNVHTRASANVEPSLDELVIQRS
jgi:hypothetical protein